MIRRLKKFKNVAVVLSF
ncbi:Protein of unknown function [Bacillus mycoides]|nr:Protein of unknown function [Bacillus mycoides]